MPEPKIDYSISEICFGVVEGMNLDEIESDWGLVIADKVRAYRKGHMTASFPRGSKLMYDLRVLQWLQFLDRKYPNKIVVFFGHGTQTNAIDSIISLPLEAILL